MAPTQPALHTLLLTARKDAGLTQQALADKIHKREKDVSRWEQGRNVPGTPTLALLSDALDLPMSDLVDAAVRAAHSRPRRGKHR